MQKKEKNFLRVQTYSAQSGILYIGITNGEKVWVYDLEKKTCIQKVNCVEDERKGCSPGAVAFSADGNILAVGLSTTLNGEWKSEEDGLFLLSTVDGSVGRYRRQVFEMLPFTVKTKWPPWNMNF